jgi:hypothetical protein
MPQPRDLAGTVSVDGDAYSWALTREPQWCTVDGWKGMSVALRREGEGREAILEFPMPKRALNGSPQRQRPQINGTIITNGVRAALEAGWEPWTRGKPVVFAVDANGC